MLRSLVAQVSVCGCSHDNMQPTDSGLSPALTSSAFPTLNFATASLTSSIEEISYRARSASSVVTQQFRTWKIHCEQLFKLLAICLSTSDISQQSFVYDSTYLSCNLRVEFL